MSSILKASMVSAVLAVSGTSVHAVLLNELKVNPPNSRANTQAEFDHEYIELIGSPNEPLTNVYLAQVHNNRATNLPIRGNAPGRIDWVLSLDGLALGDSGLMMIQSPTGAYPLPTGVSAGPALPDRLRNNRRSFLLIQSTNPLAVGNDLDLDNDGLLDFGGSFLPLSAQLLDGVGWSQLGRNPHDIVYGADLSETFVPDAATRINGLTHPNTASDWYWGELAGGNANGREASNTFRSNPSELSSNFPIGEGQLTPAAANVPTSAPVIVPEPLPASLAGLATLVVLLSHTRRRAA